MVIRKARRPLWKSRHLIPEAIYSERIRIKGILASQLSAELWSAGWQGDYPSTFRRAALSAKSHIL